MRNFLNKINYLALSWSWLLALMLCLPLAHAQRDDTRQTTAAKRPQVAIADIAVKSLPPEARDTLALIEKGGPYPYDRDGIVFGNFEKRLPAKERGYYQEFTVKTPGIKHRGARRIVAGKGGEKYYTEDHYNTFRRIVP